MLKSRCANTGQKFTVKAHRGQVRQKMTANSLADLVRMSAELGAMGPAIHLILFAIRPVVF